MSGTVATASYSLSPRSCYACPQCPLDDQAATRKPCQNRPHLYDVLPATWESWRQAAPCLAACIHKRLCESESRRNGYCAVCRWAASRPSMVSYRPPLHPRTTQPQAEHATSSSRACWFSSIASPRSIVHFFLFPPQTNPFGGLTLQANASKTGRRQNKDDRQSTTRTTRADEDDPRQ
ncbi:hypothetical protein BDZ89DRAFT_231285 [Hymenopellis radicata]|nr:hypothetical protein BDZ89DRAFT_231285 [Hymenopellis radicata]